MLRLLFVGISFLSISASVSLAENLLAIRVTSDAKPVPGAQVWVESTSFADFDYKTKIHGPFKCDDDGKVKIRDIQEKVIFIYAKDSKGHLGVIRPRREVDDVLEAEDRIELIEPTTVERTLINSEGKPIVGAKCVLNFLQVLSDPQRGVNQRSTSFRYPKWFGDHETVTDEQGRFKFSNVPKGYGVQVYFKDEVYGRGAIFFKPGEKPIHQLAPAGSLQLNVEGLNNPEVLKQFSWQLFEKRDPKGSNDVTAVNYYQSSLDSSIQNGKIEGIGPGTYTFSIKNAGKIPFHLGAPVEVKIQSGKKTELTLQVKPCAEISGRLLEAVTNKPIPNYILSIFGEKNAQSTSMESYRVKTDVNGIYKVYCEGGTNYSVQFDYFGVAGYLPPAMNPKTRSVLSPIDLAPGAKHTNPDVKLTPTQRVTGRVVDKKGEPLSAPFKVYCPVFIDMPGERNKAIWTNGEFELAGLPPDIPLTFYIRKDQAVSVPEALDPEIYRKSPKFSVTESNGVTFKGKVLDQAGKPITGAKAQLYWNYQIQGGNFDLWSSILIDQSNTDAEGKFTFRGHWPGQHFYVAIKGEGINPIGDNFNDKKSGKPGETIEFDNFKATRINRVVRGVVRGLDGQPIRDVIVRNSGDTPKVLSAQTDDTGSFELKALPQGRIFLTANKEGYRWTFVNTSNDQASFTLRKVSEPAPEPPRISDQYLASEKKFLEQILEELWKTRAMHGWGATIFQIAVQFDPAIAKKWIEVATEKEVDPLKKKLSLLINQKQLLKLAQDNLEDAIDVILQLDKSYPGFKLVRLGEQLLPIDKEKSLRLAEEAALRTRKYDPSKVYYISLGLAEAGELAWKAGNKAGGRKLLEEGLDYLKKAPAGQKNDQAIGEVAGHLSIMDWPAASKILESCNDPIFYNRGLERSLLGLAQTDFPAAKKNLKLFKKELAYSSHIVRIRLALLLAEKDFDEALKLIDDIQDGSFRFQGWVELAQKIHAKNPAGAYSLIDRAFAFLESHGEDFRRWLNFGGRAAFAGQAVYKAKQMGYPDLHALIARTLSFRSEPNQSANEQKETNMHTAFALAFTDPETARILLDRVYPDDTILEAWVSGHRKGIFLLALTDPEKALAAVKRESAKGLNQQSFSRLGLTELLESLTQDGDRMTNFSRWGSLPWYDLERD